MFDSILFLHGFATTPRVWKHQQETLSDKYNILTDPGEAKKTNGSLAIVGWSQGAQQAINLYLEMRDRVTSLVLVSATPRFLSDDEYPHGLSSALLRNLERKVKDNLKEGLRFFYGLLFEGAHEHEIFKEMPEFTSEQILADLEKLKLEDVRGLLHKIEVPTLLIHGEKDQICLPQASYYMADIIPNVSLKIMSGVGHAPHVERPDEFSRLLKEFV
ncbi:MAG: alpha/beta fold hydrolase [Candidatus Margulisiibacteriota bacterium]|nr:alpha/beta fold hydrolase [Candidatus Margulisiibacteriota bacterium]